MKNHSNYTERRFVYICKCLGSKNRLLDIHCENAIQNTIGRESEVQIVFTACVKTVYGFHLLSLLYVSVAYLSD